MQAALGRARASAASARMAELIGYCSSGSGLRKLHAQYRPDGLRSRLVDTEGDKRMVWDSQGSSGYVDLLEENLP